MSAAPPRGWRAAWTLAKRTALDARDDRIVGLSGEVAFFALLSVPPLLLAVLGAMGFVARALGPEAAAEIQRTVLHTARLLVTPDAVETTIRPTVDDILSRGRADVVSIGIVVAVWSASRAVRTLMRAVTLAYNLPVRTGVRRRLLALGITVVGMALGAIAVPLFVGGPRLGAAIAGPLGLQSGFETVWRVVYWPSALLVGIGMLTTFFHIVPGSKTRWRRDLPGPLMAVVVWVAGAAGLRLYAAWSIESNATYGPLAAPIVLLLWLYVSAMAVLMGAELNASIEKLRPSVSGAAPPGGDLPESASGSRLPQP